jgi:hypothetical protein
LVERRRTMKVGTPTQRGVQKSREQKEHRQGSGSGRSHCNGYMHYQRLTLRNPGDLLIFFNASGKFVFQKASSTTFEAPNNLVDIFPPMKSHQIYGKARRIPVIPAETDWGKASETRMLEFNVTVVLFGLIASILLIVYSAMGWWAFP